MRRFANVLAEHGLRLERTRPRVLQINVGKLCNQTCVHCHVGAGPRRKEIMSPRTADRVIAWMRAHRPTTVDLTGGAPELCPEFRRLVVAARASGVHVTVRCNLTVIFEPGQQDLPEFYRDRGVEVIASLPCYLEENVDKQRGAGVYRKSIDALRRFNAVGYGLRPELVLTLVYNPVGPSVAPAQGPLEEAYRSELRRRFGIEFSRLVCLTNLPITRFKRYLKSNGQLEAYQKLLVESFNPATVDGLMCRDTINVGWNGEVFDCDFNQMVALPMGVHGTRYLWEIEPGDLDGDAIATGGHCFGCTAGSGSSCGGALT
jgi:radical SAM/Cys-rich protein